VSVRVHDLPPFSLGCIQPVLTTDFKEISMVVIRLARGGSKKRPFYSIVATDKRNRRDSILLSALVISTHLLLSQSRQCGLHKIA
jgi:hypothetical protein